jgi:hypothetical protein
MYKNYITKEYMSRHFSYRLASEPESKSRGNLSGTHGRAASKAITQLLNEKGKKTGTYDVIITERTQGSKKTERGYTASKFKNTKPVEMDVDSDTDPIVFKYGTKAVANKKLNTKLKK